jgi:hypothetical protein
MGGGNPRSEYKVGQKCVDCLYLSFVIVTLYYSHRVQPERSILKYIEINKIQCGPYKCLEQFSLANLMTFCASFCEL